MTGKNEAAAEQLREEIRTRRQRLGMRQEALAQKLGCGHCTVSNWEQGVNEPGIWAAPKLHEVLGIPWELLAAAQGIELGNPFAMARLRMGWSTNRAAEQVREETNAAIWPAKWERMENRAARKREQVPAVLKLVAECCGMKAEAVRAWLNE